MKRHILPVFLVLLLLIPSAGAAGVPSLSNFQKRTIYTPGQYTDVAASAWYAGPVQAAYEYGLMQGTGGSFNPSGNLTIGEAVAIASRVHATYQGSGYSFPQGTPWYQPYVDYAAANGIASRFPDYSPAISRAAFVMIMSNTVPDAAMTSINTVEEGAIPDVTSGVNYYNAVYRFYRAGILSGTGDTHAFEPNNKITRAEVSVILSSLVDPTLRKSFSLTAQPLMLFGPGGQTTIVSPNEIGRYTAQGWIQTNLSTLKQYPDQIAVSSIEDMEQKLVAATQAHKEIVTFLVPAGQEAAYSKALGDDIRRFNDIANLRRTYTNGKGELKATITYPDAVRIMAYLEGRTTSLSSEDQSTLQAARTVCTSVIHDGMSEYDKVKALHDYLVNFNTYQETGDRSHAAIGALIDGKTVCEGYTRAMQLLCYLNGIEAIYIRGTSTSSNGESGNHGWNKVKVDGTWYNVDVTWDDPTGSTPMLRYDYFLISDSKLSKNHQWTNYPHIPASPRDYSA
ncbi:MAG: hypothetical protein HFE97_07300 [Oscillospiraceae bacterium]|nr:hypothetical protein [Oscillospiraceae bacterium]